MVALSAMPLPQTVGELWRWDGEEDGWFHIGGPGTEDDEEASLLTGVHTLYTALDILRGIETSEIDIPGPAARWQQALRVGYAPMLMPQRAYTVGLTNSTSTTNVTGEPSTSSPRRKRSNGQ